MNKKQKQFELRVIAVLTLITNLFIIAGVTRHWNYGDNTKLAKTQQEATEIQAKATHGTGCKEAYQDAN